MKRSNSSVSVCIAAALMLLGAAGCEDVRVSGVKTQVDTFSQDGEPVVDLARRASSDLRSSAAMGRARSEAREPWARGEARAEPKGGCRARVRLDTRCPHPGSAPHAA